MPKNPMFEKVEQLLRDYNSMKARVKNLELDIEMMDRPIESESPEETIEAMYYNKAKNGGAPPPGSVSDRTSSVALAFRKANQETNHDMTWNLIHDKSAAEEERDVLLRVLAKIDNAIASLDDLQQKIIRGFYIEKKGWIKITNEVNYRERNCFKIRDKAIEYMAKSIYGVNIRTSA